MKISIILSSLLITLVAAAPTPGLGSPSLTSLTESERSSNEHSSKNAKSVEASDGLTGSTFKASESSASNDKSESERKKQLLSSTGGRSPGFTSLTESERASSEHSRQNAKSMEASNGLTGSTFKASESSSTHDKEEFERSTQFLSTFGATPFGMIGSSSSSSSDRSSSSSSSSSFNGFSSGAFATNFQQYSANNWNQYEIRENRVIRGGSSRYGWMWGGRGYGTCGRFNINYSRFPVCAMTQAGDNLSVFSLQTIGSEMVVTPYRSSGFSSFSQETESSSHQSGGTYFKNGEYGMFFQKDSHFKQSTHVVNGYTDVFSSSSNGISGAMSVSLIPRRVCVNGTWIVIFEHPQYRPMLCGYNGVQKLHWFKDCSRPIKYCVPTQLVIFGY